MDHRTDSESTSKQRRLVVIVITSLIVICAGIACAMYAYNSYLNTLDEEISVANSETAEKIEEVLDTPTETVATERTEPFYVALFGSDQRDDEVSRSDVMILTRIDPAENKITMVSLPRDIMVDLDAYGIQKLNAAYAFEGIDGAIAKIKELSGVPISHFVEIHFDETIQAIDSLGGIDVDVSVSNDETGATSIDVIDVGQRHMDGETALSFARERYGYARGDFQRADNQRLVIQAVIDKVLSLPAYEIPETVRSLLRCVTTDMKASEILSLASAMKNSEEVTIYSAIAPCDTAMIDGVSYDILDEEAFAEMMALMDQGKDPSAAQTGESAPDSNFGSEAVTV